MIWWGLTVMRLPYGDDPKRQAAIALELKPVNDSYGRRPANDVLPLPSYDSKPLAAPSLLLQRNLLISRVSMACGKIYPQTIPIEEVRSKAYQTIAQILVNTLDTEIRWEGRGSRRLQVLVVLIATPFILGNECLARTAEQVELITCC